MSREVTFTDPGEGIHEAEIVEVLVAPGDRIEEGDTVLVVETDKATTDLPSPHSGEVEEVSVSEGDTVEVGDVLLLISDEQEAAETDAADEPAEEAAGRSDSEEAEEPADEAEEEREEQADEEREHAEEDEGGKAAAVGELPTEEPSAGERDTPDRSENGAARERSGGPVPASPSTRRLARERGVDLTEIEPTGEHGRVTAADVEAAAEGRPSDEESREPAEDRDEQRETEREEAPEVDHERWGPVERVPLRGVRRTTARRLTESWQQIPHVTHHDVLDVTALERWRRQQAPRVEEAGGELTLMVLLMKAVAGVLPRHPRFNASLEMEAEELVLKQHYHLAIAVDTEDGLIVPVVRDVDRRSLIDLSVEVSDLVARVRDRDIEADELRGGTFTITNVGPLGGSGFTPLIQLPQVAILGMGRARLEQVVTGDLDAHRTEVQFRLPLSLAYDHRVADGADAARFVGELAEAIADPGQLLLTT